MRKTRKYIRHLSADELRTLAALCAGAALLLAVALVLSGSVSTGGNTKQQAQDEQKPWAMELP